MLKVWLRANLVNPLVPRQWSFCMMWLLLLPVLSIVLIGSTELGPLRRPSVNQGDEIGILLHKYGFLSNKTKFVDTLVPTVWAEKQSSLGSGFFKLEQAVRILNCSSDLQGTNTSNGSLTAPTANNSKTLTNFADPKNEDFEECPRYFSWIQEDLAPWKEFGISRSTLELGKRYAAFRATIIKGTLYIDLYRECYQSRLLFTIWGLLLLLEKYKNKIPNVEFMFNCWDRPYAKINNYVAIPIFSYYSNREYYDIPWPDWSLWGWSERHIASWDQEFQKITNGSKAKEWKKREKKACWRGNTFPGKEPTIFQAQLLSCHNTTDNSNVDVIVQDWYKELSPPNQNSKLEDQCTHRYMVYAEEVSLSASLKYIMACGSTTMIVAPNYYDFFQRGLQPGVHYVQVRPKESCSSQLCPKLNEMVNTGELNPLRGEAIGEKGQTFVETQVSMDKVYDYMYHVLVQYAMVQDFQPMISSSANLVTQDYILCLAEPRPKLLMKQAKKRVSSNVIPCYMSNNREIVLQDYGWEAYRPANSKC